jgi:hypothetical protein
MIRGAFCLLTVLSLQGTGRPLQSADLRHQTVPKSPTQTITSPSLGHFVGVVKAQWRPDGRTMTLLEDFSYVDPDGLVWNAPKGLVTDGASIPKLAWSLIGGPFEGQYRDAAVVHDAACDRKDRTWEAVHEMFYRAMLTSHVDLTKAKIMYAAVYHFGPRWESIRILKGVAEGSLSAAVANVQSSLGSTNSEVNVLPADPSSTADQNFTLRLSPLKKTLTQADFVVLEKLIEKQEKAQPNSVSIEQIRNYRPGQNLK